MIRNCPCIATILMPLLGIDCGTRVRQPQSQGLENKMSPIKPNTVGECIIECWQIWQLGMLSGFDGRLSDVLHLFDSKLTISLEPAECFKPPEFPFSFPLRHSDAAAVWSNGLFHFP